MSSLKDLITNMQFYVEPDISWSRWFLQACLQEDSQLTELGTFLQSKLSGGTFIDVPCGFEQSGEQEDCAIALIVQKLGVSAYIEVDNNADVLGDRLKNPQRTIGTMNVQTHRSDILAYVSSLQKVQNTRVIYISGLQPEAEFCKNPENQSQVIVPYLEALFIELERCSSLGDLVILNETDTLVQGLDENLYAHMHPSIALMKHGFVLKRTCAFGKVSVYEKGEEGF